MKAAPPGRERVNPSRQDARYPGCTAEDHADRAVYEGQGRFLCRGCGFGSEAAGPCPHCAGTCFEELSDRPIRAKISLDTPAGTR